MLNEEQQTALKAAKHHLTLAQSALYGVIHSGDIQEMTVAQLLESEEKSEFASVLMFSLALAAVQEDLQGM